MRGGAAFRLKLIRDPRFPTVVDDILVESGTRYQDVMDPFIRGAPVSRDELQNEGGHHKRRHQPGSRFTWSASPQRESLPKKRKVLIVYG